MLPVFLQILSDLGERLQHVAFGALKETAQVNLLVLASHHLMHQLHQASLVCQGLMTKTQTTPLS